MSYFRKIIYENGTAVVLLGKKEEYKSIVAKEFVYSHQRTDLTGLSYSYLFESEGMTREDEKRAKELRFNTTFIEKGEEFDKIEDAIDEVVELSYGKHRLIWKEDDPDFDPEQEQVYGGVWTDKGLIFVAKKNKNGKWEIL